MAKGRRPVIVDVNVLITANKKTAVSFLCASACSQALLEIRSHGALVLDKSDEIFTEYRRYLNFRGQPGIGDKFFKWFIDNRGRSDLCIEVQTTQIDHPWRLFHEFPDDENIADFDRADQKYVAVSVAFSGSAKILQGTDHKWLKWAPTLETHGVNVHFLCKDEVERTARAKRKR